MVSNKNVGLIMGVPQSAISADNRVEKTRIKSSFYTPNQIYAPCIKFNKFYNSKEELSRTVLNVMTRIKPRRLKHFAFMSKVSFTSKPVIFTKRIDFEHGNLFFKSSYT